MPFQDLLGKYARTASGASVSAPTVRAFFRALEQFGAEIGEVRSACRKVEGGLWPDAAIARFLTTPEDGRLAYVLDGMSADPDVVAVARAAMAFVIPVAARIDELLGHPDAEPGEGGEDWDVDPATMLVLSAAERLHIDPMTVLNWPLGLFLDTVKAFSRPRGEHPGAPRTDAERARAAFDQMVAEPPKGVQVIGGPVRAPRPAEGVH